MIQLGLLSIFKQPPPAFTVITVDQENMEGLEAEFPGGLEQEVRSLLPIDDQ